MALFHTTVVDNQIKALDTIGTASGSIATFDTDRAENLINLEVAITATGGGGTPDSPIAINGFSVCNLSVNGTTETITFGQTVYGGSLNVGSGVLTVTHGYIKIVGTENLYLDTAPNVISLANIPIPISQTNVDLLEPKSNYATYSVQGTGNFNNNEYGLRTSGIIYYKNTSCSTVQNFRDYFALNNLEVCYKLATPVEIQLDSKQIQAIIGTNNIYADTGDIIDLKFVLSVGKAIS